MSLVALVLNLTLGVLLMAALVLGWSLERRLRALRNSHDSFARAVDDLDRAAARAEQGLADLRAATDEAAETLAGRIEKAKVLTGRLDTLLERAGAHVQPSEKAAAERAAGPAPASPPRQRELRGDLILEDEPRVAPRPVARNERAPEPRTAAVTPLRPERPPSQGLGVALTPAVRSRARVDDDLFDDGPLRAAGARR